MESAKKPHMLVAVLMTVASLFSIASLAVVAGNSNGAALITLKIVALLLVSAMAISCWVIYFKKYVDYRIANQTASHERHKI